MERIWVDARAGPLCKALGLSTRHDLLHFMGTSNSVEQSTVVQRDVQNPDGGCISIFCKRYSYTPPSWRFLARRSKARREFTNYQLFEKLGIHCARRILCLEDRDGLGRLRDAFILTEAVPQTVTLKEYVRSRLGEAENWADWRTRLGLCRQLAEMTRALHNSGGFHNDLFWRNILVQQSGEGQPTLWWIDCPRGGHAWLGLARRHRHIKDLAILNAESLGFCGQAERVRFVTQYLGVRTLDAKARRLLRKVAAYGQKRFVKQARKPQAARSGPPAAPRPNSSGVDGCDVGFSAGRTPRPP